MGDKFERVIFLDIDGVLNSRFWEDEHQVEISDGKYVDIEAVKLFSQLVKETDATVILHSGWRFWFDETMNPTRSEAKYFADAMAREGVEIVGVTPDLTTEEIRRTRKFSLVKADEILCWLQDHRECGNWVVLDDLDLHNSEIEAHQVRPNNDVGITKEDVEKAKLLLLK
ncbi:MAG: hypothetical protein IKR39_12220 [Lachnospiraceae bacterium]|nr:hypothetical protein [Lachnospiraceae bacterium]